MRPGRARISCVPCAKRKVRCDRVQPCCHCKRRPQDTCEFPVGAFDSSDGLDGAALRIAQLEAYVRRLGGDPKQANQTSTAGVQNENGGTDGKERFDQSCQGQSSSRVASALVQDDDGPSYIETPTWLSWQGDSASSPKDEKPNISRGQTYPSCGTILDRRNNLTIDEITQLLHGRQTILWHLFLSNAHPLIKIFFDWEIVPIILRSEKNLAGLPHHELALVVNIAFISVLSLTPQQYNQTFEHDKPDMVLRFQHAAESSLVRADYAGSTHLKTLQGLVLYLIGMHDRARPNILFSLWGIASRTAERMGVHRDGASLGLSVLRNEERRRLWWQIQIQEINAGRLIGKVNLMPYTDWDAPMPANIEDEDLTAASTVLPPPRKTLTGMSHCMWLYRLFRMHRETAHPPDSRNPNVTPWVIFSDVSLTAKDKVIEQMESTLRSDFLQYCDPLEPLHLYIQLGINHFAVAARRAARQPALVQARISEMSRPMRDEMLGLCVKSMEYYILLQTTEALLRFSWQSSFLFQMLSFIYIILEAHYRYEEATVQQLWDVIERVYAVHPTLKSSKSGAEISYVSRIAQAAWQRRASFLRKCHPMEDIQEPNWLMELQQIHGSGANTQPLTPSSAALATPSYMDTAIDFDSIDWATWADIDVLHATMV